MVDIINLILFVILALILVKLILRTAKRVQLIIKLNSLKKDCKASVRFHRFPFLPTALMSENPDVSVEIGDTVYLIRLYSGGKLKYVHFASPKYSVRFSRMKAGIFSVNRRGRASIAVPMGDTYNTQMKVFIIPELKTPEWAKSGHSERKIENVMIFNPAPTEVSYVTEEKTTIKVAFTGDEFYGMKIFTASSFVAYADRETRKYDELIYF